MSCSTPFTKKHRLHGLAVQWLDRALSSSEAVLLPWVSLLAYLRISTDPAIYDRPRSMADAAAVVAAWLGVPTVVTNEPDQKHLSRVTELLGRTGVGGNLVNDAHLAALAMQYGATVVSFDHDFARFPQVRWEYPR